MSESESDEGRSLAVLALLAVGAVVLLLVIVAVTVILLAVIGAFVLEVGEEPGAMGPQVEWDGERSNGEIVLTHWGGDSIDAESLEIRVDGSTRGTWLELTGEDTVNAGDDLTLSGVGDATVELVWISPDGDEVTLDVF